MTSEYNLIDCLTSLSADFTPLTSINEFCKLHNDKLIFLQTTTNKHQYKPIGFYGPIAPTGQIAPSSECLQNVVPNSEFRTCPDPEFPSALHSKFINTPNVEFLNVPLCSVPMSYLAGSKWGRPMCYRHAAVHWCLQRAHGACGRRIALDGGVASILALWR